MFFIPRRVYYLLIACAVIAVLLAVLIHNWYLLAGAISLGLLEFLRLAKKVRVDARIIAVLLRKRSDELKGFVLPTKEYVSEKAYDLIAEIETQALKNLGIFGQGGSGKSTLLSWFVWTYSNPDEMTRYGIKPVTIFAFNYHRFQKGKGDFEGLGFRHVDISKNLPHVFNPEYKEYLIRAFTVVFVSVINNQGIMTSMLSDIFREILDVAPCKSWNDFSINSKKVESKSRGLKAEICTIIASKISVLNVGRVNQIDFDFDHSVVLDYSLLPDPLSQNLYSEFYANLIYRKAEEASIAGKPHSIMLAIDECKRLLKYSEASITADLLTNARKHMRIAIATQNFTDVHVGLRHFQHFQFRTLNDEDINAISNIDALHADALRQLDEQEFIWVNDGSTDPIPIFKLDVTRIEEFRATHPQEYESIEDSVKTQQDVEPEGSEYLEDKIIDVLKKSQVAMYGYQIGKEVGFSPKDAINVRQPLRQLVSIEDDRVRTILIQLRKQEVDYFYLPESEQVHNLMTKETKKKFGNWKINFEATHGTGKSDFIISREDGKILGIECETTLKRDTADLQDRITENLASDTDTIIVLPNEKAKQIYAKLFTCKVCLIPELEEVLKNWTR